MSTTNTVANQHASDEHRAAVAYIALGANLGQASTTIQSALQELAALPTAQLSAHSSLYRTAPVGLKHQPDFINAVARLDIPDSTMLPAQTLLLSLFAIEARFGRQRSIPNAPRTLDLDLLLYNEDCLNTPQLMLPHPRMHQRAFVLAPLLEIAPDCRIPGHGTARHLLATCQDQRYEKLTR